MPLVTGTQAANVGGSYTNENAGPREDVRRAAMRANARPSNRGSNRR
jgi:hypothetical protein